MIKGITFDLWDTVFIDDSDEPKRQAVGRPSKRQERRQLVQQFLLKYQPIDLPMVEAVYDAIDAAFSKVWLQQYVTWTVRERLELILKGLKRSLPEPNLAELIRLHEEMELEFRPDFAANIGTALQALHGKYRLAVVSDAIFSPGRCLRQLLRDEGLLDYFDVLIFSDEFGRSKPHPSVFAEVCRRLELLPDEVVHIGDRESNDIIGPKNFGMHAILCTAVLDRGSAHTRADAILNDFGQLPQLIESLNTKRTERK